MANPNNNIPTEVTEAVADAMRLFHQTRFRRQTGQHDTSQPLPSLLERCEQYISENRKSRKQPVRLIHQFACTGGTLITKCLTCSPNVLVLSEVDPLSSIPAQKSKFNPTDMIQLLQQGNRGASMNEKLALFRASLGVLYDSAERKGLRMLMRDHTHSHFCTGESVPVRPTLAQLVSESYNTRSIIIVRHPLDSWLSLIKNGWITFSPGTLEEYAQRYQAFLAEYPKAKIYKYEDFVDNPEKVLGEMCTELELPFPADFQALFMAHSFSGDSGRKGDVIKTRDRRPVPDDLVAQVQDSLAFQSLCERLQYDI